MAFSVNRVMIAGNLTRDPQLRFVSGNKAVVNFSIAANRRFKKDDEWQDETTFVDVEAWGRTAELVGQYLTKGSRCFVEGRLKLDLWTDQQGQKRSRLKVLAENVQFLDRAPGNQDSGDPPRGSSQPQNFDDFGADDDGAPF